MAAPPELIDELRRLAFTTIGQSIDQMEGGETADQDRVELTRLLQKVAGDFGPDAVVLIALFCAEIAGRAVGQIAVPGQRSATDVLSAFETDVEFLHLAHRFKHEGTEDSD